MRFMPALLAACILGACTQRQAASERALLEGTSGHSAQVVLDTEAILMGMERARLSSEQLARSSR